MSNKRREGSNVREIKSLIQFHLSHGIFCSNVVFIKGMPPRNRAASTGHHVARYNRINFHASINHKKFLSTTFLSSFFSSLNTSDGEYQFRGIDISILTHRSRWYPTFNFVDRSERSIKVTNNLVQYVESFTDEHISEQTVLHC